MVDENSNSFVGEKEIATNGGVNEVNNDDRGWKTVSYQKKSKKSSSSKQVKPAAAGDMGVGVGLADRQNDVFRSIEQHSEERRRKILEAQRFAAAAAVQNSAVVDDDGDEGSDDAEETPAENGGGEVKKSKPKKPKKPKVTVSEAASKIDASDLSAFLADISVRFFFFFPKKLKIKNSWD